jgi:hypothetical protein
VRARERAGVLFNTSVGERTNVESRTLATETKADGAAHEAHFDIAELGNASPYRRSSHGDGVVEIDDAGSLHPIFDVEPYFGRNAANRGRDRSDGDPRQILHRSLSRQQQDGSRLVRTCKLVETDLAAL